MKFLISASTAALVGLLSLTHVALGEDYFKCSHNQLFYLSFLEMKIKDYDLKNVKSGDPTNPHGQFYKTFRGTLMQKENFFVKYIFQLIDDTPTFRVHEKIKKEWKQCAYIKYTKAIRQGTIFKLKRRLVKEVGNGTR